MERELITKPSGADRLYIIFNIEASSLSDQARAALLLKLKMILEAGATLVQLRAKTLKRAEFLQFARRALGLNREFGAKILINTYANICGQSGAFGVHRPARGPSPERLRREIISSTPRPSIEKRALIGLSTHSLAELGEAATLKADFATLSPIYPTPSKPGYGPALGIDILKDVAADISLPVYALGGITPERVHQCIISGASGVAVMGGIMRARAPGDATRAYLEALDQAAPHP